VVEKWAVRCDGGKDAERVGHVPGGDPVAKAGSHHPGA
jgi:hypothetical protein